jgi:hypothetical protein
VKKIYFLEILFEFIGFKYSPYFTNNAKKSSPLLLLIVFCILFNQCEDKTKGSQFGCPPNSIDEPPSPPMSFGYKLCDTLFNLMSLDINTDTIKLSYYNKLIFYKNGNDKIYLQFV